MGVQDLYNTFTGLKNSKYQAMWNYYIGTTDTESNYKKSKLGNNRIVHVNYIKKLIDEEVAFSIGNKINYIKTQNLDEIINDVPLDGSKVEEKIINAIMKNNSNVDIESMTNLLIFGKAHELYYIQDNKFKMLPLNPLNSYVNVDSSGKVIDAIRVYTVINKDNESVTMIDYITNTDVTSYDSDFKVVEVKPHAFMDVPIGTCKLINDEVGTLFNTIKSIQDSLESVLSDFTNELGDTRLSYLILKNMGLSDEEILDADGNVISIEKQVDKIIKYFRDNGIILLQESEGVEGDAKYLLKNASTTGHVSFINMSIDLIYQLSQHINLNEQQSSNTSGVALLTRIISLRNKMKIQQNCFSSLINRRLKYLFRFVELYYNKNFDANSIEIKFTLNVPSDDSSVTDIMTKLIPLGVLSAETGLSNLSFINNPSLEYEKALSEQKDKLNLMNTDENIGHVE